MKERLPIFRAGTHRDEKGRTWTFSEADVAASAAAYDPALSQAPHVLGHPKGDDPAWGWSKGLEAEGGVLYSIQEQVAPAFAEAVEEGRYKFRSAAFYEPNDPANPKPGVWYLRHVGWLGVQPPSVKGLGAAFSENAAGDPVTFSEADGFWVKDILRGLRDWIIDKFSLDEADKVIPAYAIENVDREGPKFGEGASPATVAEAEEALGRASAAAALIDARAADLDAREVAIAAREAQGQADQVTFAETARQSARSDDAAFVDQLVNEGRMSPVLGEQAKTLMGVLDGDSTVAFAEPDVGARDQFRDFIGQLGVSIHFSEVAPSDGVRFSENPTAEQFATQIRDEQAQAAQRGETLSASQAAARLGR